MTRQNDGGSRGQRGGAPRGNSAGGRFGGQGGSGRTGGRDARGGSGAGKGGYQGGSGRSGGKPGAAKGGAGKKDKAQEEWGVQGGKGTYGRSMKENKARVEKAKKAAALAAKQGPKAFADERFGLDLGPVKRRRRGPSKRVTATPRVQNEDGERLQKVMAHAGVASRRVCEEMIETGRVEVNGEIVRELGVRVKPDVDTVHVDGVRLQLNEDMTYFVFNKPAGVVSSMKDPDGRRDISDFLREGQSERLFHVGRLDYETEGLLLLTNDGELAHRLTHPSFEVPKTYLVQVRGPLPQGVGQQLRDGVDLEDGRSRVDSFRLIDSTPGHVLVEVVLHSGKNRIVRRMFDAVGFPVQRLVRVQIGPIRLGDQRQGSLRRLGKQEVGHLLAEVGL
ncbi:pseudouridine synthase [Galactobacter valiniphilus]|uniref:pseudouridine synthase n=1 Tax=Galactobacter valiniphilus TaxID=2676122 RepID=UPI0037356722